MLGRSSAFGLEAALLFMAVFAATLLRFGLPGSLPQIPPADLYLPILAQLAPTQLPLGDGLPDCGGRGFTAL